MSFQLYELKNENEIFLQENKNNLHVQFHNEEFVVIRACLANVFALTKNPGKIHVNPGKVLGIVV